MASLVSALLGFVLAPGALGHSDDMTAEELMQTIAEAGGASPADLESVVLSELGAEEGHEHGTATAAAPGQWYSRAPTAARIGASDEDPYALAGGCFSLRSDAGGFVSRDGVRLIAGAAADDAEVFRFQPTDLGSYLLLGSEGRFPASQGGELQTVAAPAQSAIWKLEGDGASGFVLDGRWRSRPGVERRRTRGWK